MNAHSGIIAINIYIYAQCVVGISVETFVSVGEFVRSLSVVVRMAGSVTFIHVVIG
jgi:hypothetical protein